MAAGTSEQLSTRTDRTRAGATRGPEGGATSWSAHQLTLRRRAPGTGRHLLGQAHGLLDEGLDDVGLRHGLDHLAADEDLALAVAGATPRSASRASPGPFTTQPITATRSGTSRPSSPAVTASASL